MTLSHLCATRLSTMIHGIVSRNDRVYFSFTSSTGPLALPFRGHPALLHQVPASGPVSSFLVLQTVLLPVVYPGNIQPGPGHRHRYGP